MKFVLLPRGHSTPDVGKNVVYLKIDHWNDFSFVTMFDLSIHDENGKYHEIGNVKIGFNGQTEEKSTYSTLDQQFVSLAENYFSLGVDVGYYQSIREELSEEMGNSLLSCLRDVIFNPDSLAIAQNERVFGTSLLRDTSLTSVKGQFMRVLDGGVPLTDFKFRFIRQPEEKFAGIDLDFHVVAESKPSTNIHAIIGRNGVGKTTLLDGMIASITNNSINKAQFYDTEGWRETPISSHYFSRLVSVSFSAFDRFPPPPEQSNPELGTCYNYIGLKDTGKTVKEYKLKAPAELEKEFCSSMKLCLSQSGKRIRWIKAIKSLESDDNFAAMNLTLLAESMTGEKLEKVALNLISRMSSGHFVVLLTTTKLVASVEEKTFVLIDEPESHLHPPLLSAFVRALGELLHDRNGVAIFATHSPVVLQEIPKSCVWKIIRSRLEMSKSRPELQTFGENVGILTREVFGLEVVKSGFHQLLNESVSKGGSFEDILQEYNSQLGFEAQAILRALIVHRDSLEKDQ
ncbi:MAG: AAA family ATPase [Candidatus Heimdallarchaeota archaeon]